MKARNPRSHYGCQTCRIRKVKCDETQPSCGQCTRTGRTCDGLSLTVKIHQPSTAPRLNAQQAHSFTYYIHHAGPSLSGSLDGDLWNYLIPQLSHSNMALRLALLCISTLFENPLVGSWRGTFSYNKNHRQAIKWYSQAITSTVGQAMEIQLVSCLLFMCIEAQQINVVNAMKLLKIGHGLMSQYMQMTARPPQWMTSLVYPLFLRQRILLGGSGYHLPTYWFDTQLMPTDDLPMHGLADARMQMFALMCQVAQVTGGTGFLESLRRQSLARVERWHKQVTDLITQNPSLDQATYHILMTGYHICHIAISRNVSPFPPALGAPFDDEECLPTFESILFHVEQALLLSPYASPSTTNGHVSACAHGATAFSPSETSLHQEAPAFPDNPCPTQAHPLAPSPIASRKPFSLDIGPIPALHFVGENCSRPHIRRRAIALLQRGALQENVFEADLQAWKIRQWMKHGKLGPEAGLKLKGELQLVIEEKRCVD